MEEDYRICDECNYKMEDGFVIEGGTFYYCTEECRRRNMTDEEYFELYDDGEGDTYWTYFWE